MQNKYTIQRFMDTLMQCVSLICSVLSSSAFGAKTHKDTELQPVKGGTLMDVEEDEEARVRTHASIMMALLLLSFISLTQA